MRQVWRVATDAKTYGADDITGTGASITGGRWNNVGTPLIYASPTISLAMLETLAHVAGSERLPLNRYIVRLNIPDMIMDAAEVVAAPPVGWDADPSSQTSSNFGEAWVKSGKTAILRVPSVIVPEELNVLINPAHLQAKQITTIKMRKVPFDRRLRGT